MATRTIPFDAARYLRSSESQVEMLADALESGDAGYVANALGVIARARGMSDVARGAGVTREALYKTLSRKGDPKLTTLLGVMRTLGLTLSVQSQTKPARSSVHRKRKETAVRRPTASTRRRAAVS